MAKISNYTFASSDDRNTSIHAVRWEPDDGNIKAALQLVHGMGEYIMRYDEYARFMADKGFAVYGHDHIGHGESVINPDELGLMHCRYPDETMVEDIYSNYKIIKAQHPDKPYFILGHSMGSYLLREFLSAKSPKIKGVNGAIIMGTGTEPDAAIFAGRTLCSLLMKINGRDRKSNLIKGLMFGKAYKQFDTTGMHPENSWLSKNVENVLSFTDPNKNKYACEFSLNGYMVLLRATWYDNRMSNIRNMNMDTPILFVSGDQDPVGAMGTGVKKAYDKFAAAGVKDLSIRLYEGDRHEILNETDRNIVYNDLYKWMLERL